MPCYDPELLKFPEKKYLSNMLCNACKNLSIEQMRIIIGDTYRDNLWIWYQKHLITDFLESIKNNNMISYKNLKDEAERLNMIFAAYERPLREMFGLTLCSQNTINLIPKLKFSEGWVAL